MTCKDCIRYDVCLPNSAAYGHKLKLCSKFKNKADFVEVETLKAWLYEIAINNVGCVLDGDFSDACQEIISRLDGLRKFAQERRNM